MALTLMTTAQVAKRLRVDPRTIHRMVEDGRIAAEAKLPGETGAYLFAPAEVDRFEAELGNAEAAAG